MQVACRERTDHVATAARWSVETIGDPDAFAAIESEWNETVERAGIEHPFLTHEWLYTWWQCFGGESSLHIVVVRSGGRIIAIAPLVRETTWMYGVPVRRLRLMHNDHTPRADFIVAEDADAAYRAIWAALLDQGDGWDVLQLGQITSPSTTRDMMSRFAAADGCVTGVWRSSNSPYLALSGTWDQYFGSLSGKFRQNVRNRLARVRRHGEPVLEVVDGGPELDLALHDAVRLEESGWKQRAGTAITSDPAVTQFYARLADRAARRGWLRLLFLTVNGCRIATSYSLCYARRLFLCKTGYDPDYDTCSPFKVLTYLAVRDSFVHGLREVEFLGDTEPWKMEWTSTARSHEWLFVFSTTPRARLVHRLKFQMAPAVGAILRRRAGNSDALHHNDALHHGGHGGQEE